MLSMDSQTWLVEIEVEKIFPHFGWSRPAQKATTVL